MAPKKRANESQSPTKSPKKAKTASGALDAFFARPSASQSKQEQLLSDEAFARKLAAEEELLPSSSSRNAPVKKGQSSHTAILVDDDDDTALPLPVPASSTKKALPSTAAPSLPVKSEAKIVAPSAAKKAPKAQTAPALPETPISYPDLGQDPLLLDVSQCPWSPSAPSPTPAPYSFLSHVLLQLSSTRSRILMLNTLTNALRFLILYDPPSLVPALYMVSNSIAPSYVPNMELAVGPRILSNALMSVSGLSSGALKKLYNTHGDPGDVAFIAKASVRTLIPHAPLTLSGVFESLLKIVRARGQGAQKQKQSIVERLLLSARGEEVRFIMRTLSMHLRVGAVRTTVLSAFARAAVLARPVGQVQVVPPESESPFFASAAQLAGVLLLPDKKGKKNAQVDEARMRVLAKMAASEALFKAVYVKHPNFDTIVREFLSGGVEGLEERVPLTVEIPLHATLGSPTRSLDEIYARLGDLTFAAEYKYDGQRAQIHASTTPNGDVNVKIFSRHLEDMTDKYPDIVLLINDYISPSASSSPSSSSDATSPPTSFILDAEIVAYDPTNECTKSFQELSNRPRKDVGLGQIRDMPVCLFVFDLMYLSGESLLSTPFRARRTLLHHTFPRRVMPPAQGGARLKHVSSIDSDAAAGDREGGRGRDEIQEFWEGAVDAQCEGLMIKLLDSGEVVEEVEEGAEVEEESGEPVSPPKKKKKPNPNSNGKGGTRKKPLPATYEPDKRTSAWLKLKKDYVKGIGDTLDLVPIGAWHGNGRKAKWWSPVLLAVWDPDEDKLVAVCKCMSGFTDGFYKALSERYPEGSETCSSTPLGNYEVGGLRPPVYFTPREVWEVACAEITISPVSVAAIGSISSSRGLSVRFPRFVRIREDKRIEDATPSSLLADMWRRQEARGKEKDVGKGEGDDEGDYLVDADLEESEGEVDAYEDEDED